ncbi:MAG TPA: hypothetical protein DCF63_09855 [Planctomycetaceae bacterium]|nr:hypothetical protein [Planctomycetaceae bacterium]
MEIKVQHNARLRAEVNDLQRRLDRLQDFVVGLTDPERDGWLVQPQCRRKAAYFLDEAKK